MKFIHKKKFIADLGITTDVFDHWRKAHWEKGFHYIIVGHQTLLDKERVEKWVESKFTENLQPEFSKEGIRYKLHGEHTQETQTK